MIKANELRIGNCVLLGGKNPTMVTQIDTESDTIKYLDGSSGDHIYLPSGFATGADHFRQWASENLNIDIDVQLKYDQGTRKASVASMVLEAIKLQAPFVLHNGPQLFCVIIPKLQIIVIYTSNGSTTEVLNEKQFQNRVKMLYVIYPQFAAASVKLIKSTLELAVQQWKDYPQTGMTG